MKTCTKCKEIKEIDYFYKDSQKSTGISSICKKCSNEKRKIWNFNNKEKRRFISLQSATGITKKQYLDILKLQENKCAICNISFLDLNKNLSVDHCHNSNLIRGLLCTKCNIGLGYFNDDENLLVSAINYLKNNFNYMNIKYKTKNE